MIDQNNFSIGACTLVLQIMPSCVRDVTVDKVHMSGIDPVSMTCVLPV